MPTKTFRSNIYSVEMEIDGHRLPTPLQQAIQRAAASDLADREKDVSGKIHRLNSFSLNSPLFLLNFITFEYSWSWSSKTRTTLQIDYDESR